jgi:hypothetical protein
MRTFARFFLLSGDCQMKLNKLGSSVFSALVLILSSNAFATPAEIVIIRHGEKPKKGDELSQQGCERAYTLPQFFESSPVVNAYGRPVAIYASQPDHAGSSMRPAETITPTAEAMGIEVQDPVTRLDYGPIVQDIMNNPSYNGRTVLISWEHDAIPGLVEALGVKVPNSDQKWPDDVFDEAWILTFSGKANLQIIPENVLPGDNPDGGKEWKNPPGPGGAIPSDIADRCVNNNQLDSEMTSITSPPVTQGE